MRQRQHNTLAVVIVPRTQADAESARRLRAIVDIALAARRTDANMAEPSVVSPEATRTECARRAGP